MTETVDQVLSDILNEVLSEAEDRFGPRAILFEFKGFKFERDFPHLFYPEEDNPYKVGIVLTETAKEYLLQGKPEYAYFQLAHESIHLLSPTGEVKANFLEEGLAEAFANCIMVEKFKDPTWWSGEDKREMARRQVRRLLMDKDRDAIKKIRMKEPMFLDIKPEQIMETCSSVKPHEAEALCQLFY